MDIPLKLHGLLAKFDSTVLKHMKQSVCDSSTNEPRFEQGGNLSMAILKSHLAYPLNLKL